MKHEFDLIEVKLRERLSKNQVIPNPNLWININNELKRRNIARRKRLFFLFSIIGVTFLSSILILIIFKKVHYHQNSKTQLISQYQRTIKNKNLKEKTISQNMKIKDLISMKKIVKRFSKNNYTNENEAIKEKLVFNIKSKTANSRLIEKFQNDTLLYNKTILSNHYNEQSSSNVSNGVKNIFEKTNEKISLINHETNSTINTENNNIIFNISNLKVLDIQLMDISLFPLLNAKYDKLNSNFNSKFYIGFLYSPAVNHRFLINNMPSNQLFNALKFNEKNSFNSNYCINLGYQMNQNFSFITGLYSVNYSNYFSTNELEVIVDTNANYLKFQTPFGEQKVSEDDFYVEDPNDPQEFEFDPQDSIFSSLNYVNTNNVNILKVPLNLSYSVNLMNSRFFISTGINISRIYKASSIIETSLFTTKRFSILPIINRWLIANNFEIGYEQCLNKNFSILGSINFEYSLNSITKSNQFISKPYWIFFNTGMRYYLKKK